METTTEAPKEITISAKRYARFVEDSLQLAHLNALGVDNWEGYSWYDSSDDEDDDE